MSTPSIYNDVMKNKKTKKDRLKLIWAKTNGVCAHCGSPSSGRGRTIDHFVPRSYDGGYDTRNLMPLCKKCNLARGNSPINPYEFYAYAPKKYVIQCIKYQNEYKDKRRNINGDIF